MKLSISNAFRLLTEPFTDYLNIYTMLESNGNIRVTIETSEPIEDAQSICLVLSGKQAETTSNLIRAALRGEPNVVQNVNEVE